MARLDTYDNRTFERGRARWVEALWLIAQWMFVSSAVPGSAHRRTLLRMFGARVGSRVQIKPGVRIKFPWRLTIGDHTWIGEDVWIDNLSDVAIGSHCCISQDAYLCTGSHDWKKPTFDLIVKPIRIEDRAWVAARATIAPGVTMGEGSVLGLGGVATRDLAPWTINVGNPALMVRRRLRHAPSDGALPLPPMRRIAREGACRSEPQTAPDVPKHPPSL